MTTLLTSEMDDATLQRDSDGFGAVAGGEFGEDVFEVGFDGVDGGDELLAGGAFEDVSPPKWRRSELTAISRNGEISGFRKISLTGGLTSRGGGLEFAPRAARRTINEPLLRPQP